MLFKKKDKFLAVLFFVSVTASNAHSLEIKEWEKRKERGKHIQEFVSLILQWKECPYLV
jgi:hypothetical protein